MINVGYWNTSANNVYEYWSPNEMMVNFIYLIKQVSGWHSCFIDDINIRKANTDAFDMDDYFNLYVDTSILLFIYEANVKVKVKS